MKPRIRMGMMLAVLAVAAASSDTELMEAARPNVR